MSYGTHMNELNEICTQVWASPDVKEKRNLLKRAVSTFKYKGKAHEFLAKIATANTTTCDFLASNLMLNKTDKVVSMLPR